MCIMQFLVVVKGKSIVDSFLICLFYYFMREGNLKSLTVFVELSVLLILSIFASWSLKFY